MRTMSKLVSMASAFAMVLAVGSSAFGQVQDKDQQGCINTINKDSGKVGATQGKENNACVKLGTKGTVTALCPTLDPKGKVMKAVAKAVSDDSAKCSVTPNFAYTSGAAASAAMQAAELDLLTEVFGGTDLTAVISTDKVIGKCQATMMKDTEKVAATFVKVFGGEKKGALKLGAASGATIAALQGVDAKGKIGKTVTKLGADATKACTGVTIATAFPGSCSASASPAALASCLAAAAKCSMCEGLEGADAIDSACDTIDDGLANGSCGLPSHTCVLDTTPASDSQLDLHIAALPVALTAPLSGTVTFGAAPGGGIATCEIANLTPINLAVIGFICITPGSACADGTRTCAGGPALGISVASDGLGGACTSNNQCDTIAAGACGGAANVQTSNCVGYCSLGTQAVCTSDAQCLPSNGACNGPNPVTVAQANNCQYSCLNAAAHGASGAGDLQCNLGSNLVVEVAAPCDGTDVSINVGNTCVPFSTQQASSNIVDANFVPAATVPNLSPPNNLIGTQVACATLDASTTTGMVAVGAVNFFGSSLGDIASGLRVTCQ